MRRSASWICLGFVVFFAGCGGSAATAPAASQDELSKYVAEHPESQENNTAGINP